MRIISVDDHLIEHPSVWQDRLPARYLDRAPHVVVDGSREFWVYEDGVDAFARTLGAAAGLRRDEYSLAPMTIGQMRPGCYDPVERLADMDTDGVWASMCFATWAGYAGSRFLAGKDRALALLCVKAYNDFVIDEWCAAAPDRLIPLAIVPLWDVNEAVLEIERVAARGAKSISFPDALGTLGLPSFHTGHWDPVFAAVCEAGLPLSCHMASGRQPAQVSADAPGTDGISAARLATLSTFSMAFVADLTFSHVFHLFPDLRVVLSEAGVGWIPSLKERMDNTWDRQRFWTGIDQRVRPSELFVRHFWGCFTEDDTGIRDREAIGVDNMMIESDYPHSDSTWPNTRTRLSGMLKEVPDDQAHRIVELNARAVYRLDRVLVP